MLRGNNESCECLPTIDMHGRGFVPLTFGPPRSSSTEYNRLIAREQTFFSGRFLHLTCC